MNKTLACAGFCQLQRRLPGAADTCLLHLIMFTEFFLELIRAVRSEVNAVPPLFISKDFAVNKGR